MKRTIDVIIPTYKPDKTFENLIRRLLGQSVRPRRILVMNTEKSNWKVSAELQRLFEQGQDRDVILTVMHLPQEEFDHGGTRGAAAAMSDADILLYMTQDAIPADADLIKRLMEHLGNGEEGSVAAAYARQLPNKDCSIIERYTRSFNYGEKTLVKSSKDLKSMGIKTYMCSNVCAAYVRSVYEKLGGFEKRTIFNEDMIFAAGLIQNGYKVAYVAEAKVIHSHNYSGKQQFRRNFDLAVSQADHPEIFANVKSESEGIRLVKKTAVYLIKSGHAILLPALFWQSGCKYLGYLLGKKYHKLPGFVIQQCTSNEKFWKNKLF